MADPRSEAARLAEALVRKRPRGPLAIASREVRSGREGLDAEADESRKRIVGRV